VSKRGTQLTRRAVNYIVKLAGEKVKVKRITFTQDEWRRE
jgi:hypothetical protein